MKEKQLTENIWVEHRNAADFKAFLSLRDKTISSHDPSVTHKTSKQALLSLKAEIAEEMRWLQERINEINNKLLCLNLPPKL